MDLFVVPAIGFDLLYAFVIVRLDRRDGLDQRHSKSDGRMGCTSDNGGISLGEAPHYFIITAPQRQSRRGRRRRAAYSLTRNAAISTSCFARPDAVRIPTSILPSS
jgi:hypothetical protein